MSGLVALLVLVAAQGAPSRTVAAIEPNLALLLP